MCLAMFYVSAAPGFATSLLYSGLGGDDNKPEVFFHSQSLRQLFESSAAGCHLCAILCQQTDLEQVEGQPDGGIVATCWMTLLAPAPSKVVYITLQQLNQDGQALIHTKSDSFSMEGLLAACDYAKLTYGHSIGEALISEIDGTTPPHTSTLALV